MTIIVNLQLNLNTMNSFCFAGECEDRPMPPPIDTHVQSSLVDCGGHLLTGNLIIVRQPPLSLLQVILEYPVPHLQLLLVDLPR